MIPLHKMKLPPDICRRTGSKHDWNDYEKLGDGQIQYSCRLCEGQMIVTSLDEGRNGYHVGWLENQPARGN